MQPQLRNHCCRNSVGLKLNAGLPRSMAQTGYLGRLEPKRVHCLRLNGHSEGLRLEAVLSCSNLRSPKTGADGPPAATVQLGPRCMPHVFSIFGPPNPEQSAEPPPNVQPLLGGALVELCGRLEGLSFRWPLALRPPPPRPILLSDGLQQLSRNSTLMCCVWAVLVA